MQAKLFGAVVLSLCALGSAHAEDRLVRSPTGEAIFKIRFFDQGQGPVAEGDEGEPLRSTYTLSNDQKTKIERAVALWAETIKPRAGYLPAVINVGTFDDQNAFGNSSSYEMSGSPTSRTGIQLVLTGYDVGDQDYGSDAQFVMGRLDFDTGEYIPAHLPRTGKFDIFSTAFHELAHGLGITSGIEDTSLSDDITLPRFGESLGSWAEHLRDDNGNPSSPNQAVTCTGCDTPVEPGVFDVRKDQAHFVGRHVTDVLKGAMPGVPVKMLYESVLGQFGVDDNFMSHSELKNSMMSHQNYRNYTTFMEAELAFMQDMGYTIDRRNFYGHSIYGDDQQVVNTHGYFARNAAGTAYLPGQYNTATLGTGLHVYGSRNTIVQQADLLTRGPGAAGIRVDGERNTLTIPRGTKVHADGINGRGVMFTYGKDHNLVLAGDVQAMGDRGIGASFDFGNNAMGNVTNYRGSYINTAQGVALPVLDELKGALVNTVDLTGRVAGRAQAIYISRNALVGRINVMDGARIEGDIRSDYAQTDASGRNRLTRITFGETADANGRSTGRPDASFNWRYDGNITGINNIALEPKAGTTTLNGRHQVHSVTVAPAATLAGNGRYTLKAGSTFVNAGTVSPGNSTGRMAIDGDYRQTRTGTLRMDVNGAQQTDVLAVSGTARLGGQLAVVPQAGDWYAQGWTVRSDQLLQAGALQGAFDTVAVEMNSPTLTASTQSVAPGVVAVGIGRQANAYSQYGSDANAARAGEALYQVAANPSADSQALLQNLDFSAADGSTVGQALDQITPSSYSAMTASSLAREQQIGGIVSQRATRSLAQGSSLDSAEWTGFAVPFGGGVWQDRRGSIVGYDGSNYGVLVGAEKRSASNAAWVFGGTGTVSGQSVSTKSPYDSTGKSTAFNLGVHARYAPSDVAGPYAFGQAQIGVEDGELDRRINVPGYSAKNSADWTGWNGAVTAGGGFRWALTDTISAGPIAALAYTRLSRPGVTESGPAATRLKLQSSHFNSLRSSIGVNTGVDLPLQNKKALRADVQVTWDRELLDHDATFDAQFAGYPQAGFSSRNRLVGRDSMGVRAGLSYQIKENVALGANVSSQLFLAGQRSVAGDVSVMWRF